MRSNYRDCRQVSVVSSDPRSKDVIISFVWLSMLDIYGFVSLNCKILFSGSLRKWFEHFLFIRGNGKIHSEINTFRFKKITISSTFLIKLKFQGHRCMSGIIIFAWTITWIYAYSPFKFMVWLKLFSKNVLTLFFLFQSADSSWARFVRTWRSREYKSWVRSRWTSRSTPI